MKTTCFFLFSLLFPALCRAGLLKEIRRAKNTLVGVIPGGRQVSDAIDGITNSPTPKTEQYHAGTTAKAMVIGQPQVSISNSAFSSATADDFKKQLWDLGIDKSDIFAQKAFVLKSKESLEMRFVNPAVEGSDNSAAVDVIAIRTTKQADGHVTTDVSRMHATASVTAEETVQWRKVVKQWGNNKETYSSQTKYRGLTSDEIKAVLDVLVKAIKNDDRYKKLPGTDDLQGMRFIDA